MTIGYVDAPGPAARRRAHLRWRFLHRWSSILCSAFLLMLCATGLLLIFSDEIGGIGDTTLGRPLSYATTLAHADAAVAHARAAAPTAFVRVVVLDGEHGRVVVRTTQGPDDPFTEMREQAFSAASGAKLQAGGQASAALVDAALALHARLFAGLPGECVIAVMAILFLVALLSGVALYAPFARRSPFGTIRNRNASRLRVLDMHNVVGIVIAGWMAIVGATGLVNALATPLFAIWQVRDVAPVLRPFVHEAVRVPRITVAAAVAAAEKARPGTQATAVAFPSHRNGSPRHYVIWMRGASKLRSRLLTPVLVDAESGTVGFVARMPWYLRLLEICRPLHFGDYGGWPLKLLWAALDVLTMLVLGSGLALLLRGAGFRADPDRTESSDRVKMLEKRKLEHVK